MPILGNFLMETHGKDDLKLFATDLEIAVSTNCKAEIKQQGKACLPEKKLYEIVKELGEENIEMEGLENHWVKLQTEESTFQVVGLNAGDYPKAFENKQTKRASIGRDVFLDLIDRTIYAVLEADYVQYNGILLESDKEGMRMVATDGHRLALHEKAVDSGTPKIDPVVIPKKGARELRRILSELEGDVELSVGDGFLSVWNKDGKSRDVEVMVRLLESKFPNYREVLPKKLIFQIQCEREALMAGLRRVAVLSAPLTQGVRLKVSSKHIELSLKNPDQGDATAKVPMEGKNAQDGFEILLNVHYLIDALGASAESSIELGFSGSEGAVLVQTPQEKGYLALVMPMRS